MIPAVVVTIAVMFYPLAYTIITGFHRNTLFVGRPRFTGLAQCVSLFGDKIFVGSIVDIAVWTLGSVVFQPSVGFLVTLLLNHAELRGKTVLKILSVIPWMLPSVIGSAVWKQVYNVGYGIVDSVPRTLGLVDRNKMWLSGISTAMPATVTVNIWKMFPFVLPMIEAPLQGAFKELKEAAVIDGVNRFNIFKAVTWPVIVPVCYSVILLLTIWISSALVFIYTLMEGGPAHSIEVMAMYIYKEAFFNYDFGKASAASTILSMLSVTVSFIYLRVTDKKGDMR